MNAPVTVAAALGIEARALRQGAGLETGVVQVGMRATRAARVLPRDGAPVVLAGVAGGLVPPGALRGRRRLHRDPRPERRRGPLPRRPAARRGTARVLPTGTRVHLGPTVTTERVVHGRRRRALAAEGYLAVDMEAARARLADRRAVRHRPGRRRRRRDRARCTRATVNRGRAALQHPDPDRCRPSSPGPGRRTRRGAWCSPRRARSAPASSARSTSSSTP